MCIIAISTYAGESEDAHGRLYGDEEHQSKWTHELAASAASFAGMKAIEDHQRKPHLAKEAIAALGRAKEDKLAETTGMDEVDQIKAEYHAKENTYRMYDEHYAPGRYGPHESYDRC